MINIMLKNIHIVVTIIITCIVDLVCFFGYIEENVQNNWGINF